MDAACVDYCLAEDERLKFEKDGVFIVENALPPELVEDLNLVADRLDAQYRAASPSDRKGTASAAIVPNRYPKKILGVHERLNLLDIVGRDEVLLELLGWLKIFSKVWGILGWNLKLYHSHMTVTPPVASDKKQWQKRLNWHQDSGRLHIEL